MPGNHFAARPERAQRQGVNPMQKPVRIGPLSLTLTDIIVIKAGLSVALTAAFLVPPPWHIPVGVAANLIWIWRL